MTESEANECVTNKMSGTWPPWSRGSPTWDVGAETRDVGPAGHAPAAQDEAEDVGRYKEDEGDDVEGQEQPKKICNEKQDSHYARNVHSCVWERERVRAWTAAFGDNTVGIRSGISFSSFQGVVLTINFFLATFKKIVF